jgi:hypothetical protein
VPGPAAIETDDATILVQPGWTAVPDAAGNLVLTAAGPPAAPSAALAASA